MKDLTPKEEEIMNFFWQHGKLFVNDILKLYNEPKPHFNTVSTIVRGLEERGLVGHESFGKSYRYHALVSASEVGMRSLKSVVSRFFKNSCLGAVSTLVKDEEISVDELRRLIDEVENGSKS